MDRLAKGAVFSSYEQFEEVFKEYQSSNKVVFCSVNTRPMTSYNEIVKDQANKWPIEWKYKTITFQCKFAGKHSSKSQGKKCVSTFKRGCEAHIRLCANKKLNGLVVTDVILEHNHRGLNSESDARVIPECRKLTDAALMDVRDLLTLQLPAAKIVNFISSKHGIPVMAYDIHNQRRKRKHLIAGTEDERIGGLFTNILEKDPGASIRVIKDEKDVASILFIQTSDMKSHFLKYPSVLFLDCTYKLNSRKMPLCNLMVVDGNGIGQVVGQGVVINESKEVLKKFLELFVSLVPNCVDKIKSVVVDKDFAEIKAIGEVLPNAQVIFCKFHLIETFQRQLVGFEKAVADEVKTLVTSMLKCSTVEEYESYREKLHVFHPEIGLYFNKNWDNCKEHWAGCYVQQHTTYGNLTNNIVESYHSKVKEVVTSNYSLPEMIEKLSVLSNQKTTKAMNLKSKLSLKKQVVPDNIVYPDVVSNIISKYAPTPGSLVRAEFNKFVNEVMIVNNNTVKDVDGKLYNVSNTSCSCFVATSQQLVCRHIFAFRASNSLSLFSPDTDVPVQHSLANYLADAEPVALPEGCNISVHGFRPKVMNRSEKCVKAKEVLNPICDILSELEQSEFDTQLKMFSDILDCLKSGQQMSLSTAAGNVDLPPVNISNETSSLDFPIGPNSELSQKCAANPNRPKENQCDVKPFVADLLCGPSQTDLKGVPNSELSPKSAVIPNEPKENQCDVKPFVTNLLCEPNSELSQKHRTVPVETEESQCDVKPCVTKFVVPNSEISQRHRTIPNETEESQCDVKPCVPNLIVPNSALSQRHQTIPNGSAESQCDVEMCDTDLHCNVSNCVLPQTRKIQFLTETNGSQNFVKQGVTDISMLPNSEPRQIQNLEGFPAERNDELNDACLTDLALVSDCASAPPHRTMYSPVPMCLIENRMSQSVSCPTVCNQIIPGSCENENNRDAKDLNIQKSNSQSSRPISADLHQSNIDCFVSSYVDLENDIAGKPVSSFKQPNGRENAYKCNSCSRRFTSKVSLDRHMRTQCGGMPFKCNECGKSFTRNSSLRLHMRTHSVERPFK